MSQGAGLLSIFCPGAVISQNFLPRGREFDCLKNSPGVSPGGCWCLELTDALESELTVSGLIPLLIGLIGIAVLQSVDLQTEKIRQSKNKNNRS